MKKIIIILCLFSNLNGIAQEKNKQFSTQAGITASTTAAYSVSGIDTTLKNAFTLAPFVRIMSKSGLGVSYSVHTLLSGAEKKLFMHTASAFYEEYDKPVNLSFSFTHFFFTNNSAIPYTPITNELYGYVAYKKLWLAPAVATSIGFGQDENSLTQAVFNVAAGVTHNFSFSSKTNSEANISPSIFLNGGSNKYYSFLQTARYITKNTGKKGFLSTTGRGRGRRNGTGTGGTTTTTTATNSFTLNNVELNVYSSFNFGNFEIVPAGSVFIPLVSNSQVSAYWELKFAYNFGK